MSSVVRDMRSNANMSIQVDSLTSNCLTAEERGVIRRSDRKAAQVLGVTLTRDVNAVGKQLSLTPFLHITKCPLIFLTPSDTLTRYRDFGILMAKISAKRRRSRQASNFTLVGTLKDFGVKMTGLDKLLKTYGRDRKKQRYASPQRVVLDSRVGSNTAGRTDSYGRDADEYGMCLDQDATWSHMPLARRSILPVGDDIEQSEDETTLVDQFVRSQPRFPLAPLSLVTDEHANGLDNRHSMLDISRENTTCCPFPYDPYDCTLPADSDTISTSTDSYDAILTESDFAVDNNGFWDFMDPFNASRADPAYAFVLAYYSKMHLGDRIAPHMKDDTGFAENFPFAHLLPPSPLWHDMESSHGSVGNLSLGAVGGTTCSAYRTSPSRDSVDSITYDENLTARFLRADLDHLNAVLQAQEAYEHREEIAEEMARREKRAKARSKLKQIALLGEEARQAIITAP